MKYLVILMILFPMVVFSQTSSKPTPGPFPTPGPISTPTPGPEKCNPPCTSKSTCQMDTENGTYHCVSGGKNLAQSKCSPPCAKNQSCQIDSETGQYACVSGKPSGSQLSPIPTPGPGATDKDQKEFHNLVLSEKGILICQSKFAITSPELELKCILSNQAEAKASLKELYRNNWKLINAMKTEKGYLYYLDKK